MSEQQVQQSSYIQNQNYCHEQQFNNNYQDQYLSQTYTQESEKSNSQFNENKNNDDEYDQNYQQNQQQLISQQYQHQSDQQSQIHTEEINHIQNLKIDQQKNQLDSETDITQLIQYIKDNNKMTDEEKKQIQNKKYIKNQPKAFIRNYVKYMKDKTVNVEFCRLLKQHKKVNKEDLYFLINEFPVYQYKQEIFDGPIQNQDEFDLELNYIIEKMSDLKIEQNENEFYDLINLLNEFNEFNRKNLVFFANLITTLLLCTIKTQQKKENKINSTLLGQ